MTNLAQDEARMIAANVIVQSFRDHMHDLDSTEAVNDLLPSVVIPMAIEYGVLHLSEGDLELIDIQINEALAYVAVSWQGEEPSEDWTYEPNREGLE